MEPQLALIAEEKSPARISLRGVSAINCSDMEDYMDEKKSAKEIVLLVLSSIAAFCALLGSILTVVCSAGKTFSWSGVYDGLPGAVMKIQKLDEGKLSGGKIYDILSSVFKYRVSLLCIIALIGGIVAMGTLFFATKTYMKTKGKYAMFAIIISAAAVIIGIVPTSTVCIHNCNLNGQTEEVVKDALRIYEKSEGGNDYSDSDSDSPMSDIFGN